MLYKNKVIGIVLCAILGFVVIAGFVLYNNFFYAQRVLKAIDKEDVPALEKLMEYPFGNLNSKPTLWIVEVVSEKSEPTPLQAACKKGNLKIVEMLLENGADVNYTHWDVSRNQGSALTNAASSLSDERLQILELLLEYGADVSYTNNVGNDALSCAVYASYERSDTIKVIELLEKNGANIYKRYSESNNSLLHKACECDNFSVIQYLIEQRNFDVNSTNADGDTPLIYFTRFASERDGDTLALLIEKGAEKGAKNKEGKTAYDYAVERHPEFAGLLNAGT